MVAVDDSQERESYNWWLTHPDADYAEMMREKERESCVWRFTHPDDDLEEAIGKHPPSAGAVQDARVAEAEVIASPVKNIFIHVDVSSPAMGVYGDV